MQMPPPIVHSTHMSFRRPCSQRLPPPPWHFVHLVKRLPHLQSVLTSVLVHIRHWWRTLPCSQSEVPKCFFFAPFNMAHILQRCFCVPCLQNAAPPPEHSLHLRSSLPHLHRLRTPGMLFQTQIESVQCTCYDLDISASMGQLVLLQMQML